MYVNTLFMIKHIHLSHSHSANASILRTIIFTLGHYCIDVLSQYFVAGTPIHLAMTACIVGPILNAFWYFILDRVFFSYLSRKIKNKKENG